MPTIPRNPMEEADPRALREVAEAFGADAERYDRTRPRYPDELVRAVVEQSPGRTVLDAGAGTGIVGVAFQQAGCEVLGVEPDARMAAFATSRHGLPVEVARFEEWDPAGRTFDTVTAGTAWHWIDPAAGAAKAAQALRPGGQLAIFWNIFQPTPDVAAALTEVYLRVLPDHPMYGKALAGGDAYQLMFDRFADGIRGTGAFQEPVRTRFDWAKHYDRDGWLDQVPTFGGASALPPATLATLLTETGKAIDALGGSFTMGYAAVLLTAVRQA